jgi:hypothetical protein
MQSFIGVVAGLGLAAFGLVAFILLLFGKLGALGVLTGTQKLLTFALLVGGIVLGVGLVVVSFQDMELGPNAANVNFISSYYHQILNGTGGFNLLATPNPTQKP